PARAAGAVVGFVAAPAELEPHRRPAGVGDQLLDLVAVLLRHRVQVTVLALEAVVLDVDRADVHLAAVGLARHGDRQGAFLLDGLELAVLDLDRHARALAVLRPGPGTGALRPAAGALHRGNRRDRGDRRHRLDVRNDLELLL